MSEGEIAYCHACGGAMDVSAVGPFTNVECPSCRKHTRVKREFGPYTLTRRHAIGGMSLVFVGRDSTLDREVIVKILNEEYSADEKRIQAFEEEARITALISHPNVVRVFTTGRAFGRFYIAMEFVTGGHFEHHIREKGTIPEREALSIALNVASGLKAAKSGNLIHRDVKPGNILLDSNGRAKLVDFGLALVTKGGKAKASEIWATPYYVPPETIEGAEEDFRSDIYAFGATMYHALAGIPPCNEESMDTKRLREAKQQVKPLEKVARWLGSETCSVIDRCMAYDPERRFRSYDELIVALKSARQQAGENVPEPARTRGVSATAARRRSSRRLGPGLALGGAALILLVAVIASVRMILDAGEVINGDDDGPVVGGGSDQPPVAVVPTDPGGSAASDRGLEVVKLYRKATKALESGDLNGACDGFAAVRDHPEVMEPTGTWAACEAVIAGYLAGDSARARKELVLARSHLEQSSELDQGVRKRLERNFRELSTFPPVAVPKEFSNRNDAPLGWMMSGLKNWDQGLMSEAVPFFTRVAQTPTDGQRAWLKPYVRVSELYLKDYGRLTKAEPKPGDRSPEDCRALIDELHAVHTLLETKGRARFNVRCWQLDLERQARRKPKEVEPVAAGSDGMPAGTLEDMAQGRFDAALEKLRLWQPSGDYEEGRQRAFLLLTQSARTFLAELGERIGSGVSGVTLRSREGLEFAEIRSGTPDQLELSAGNGDVVALEWDQLEPDSLIDLHRFLNRSGGSGFDAIRRHEQAIAFDFLVGDRERASEAAERLAERSEAFKRRWESVSASFEQ